LTSYYKFVIVKAMDVILSYFQLNEHPYRIGPDPRYLYYTDQVKLAISR
jgi:hypothetical protein